MQSNGIYSIGRLIVPVRDDQLVSHATQHLQASNDFAINVYKLFENTQSVLNGQ